MTLTKEHPPIIPTKIIMPKSTYMFLQMYPKEFARKKMKLASYKRVITQILLTLKKERELREIKTPT